MSIYPSPLVIKVDCGRVEALDLKEQLSSRLHELPFEALELAICRLLTAMGYGNVQLLGRSHFVGRNRDGGADIAGTVVSGLGTQRMVVQIKQYRRDVSRRAVDELRGVVLRMRADHGILISTADISTLARRTAVRGLSPQIVLINGHDLVELCIRYRIGVTETSMPTLLIDEPFFDTVVEEASSGTLPLNPTL